MQSIWNRNWILMLERPLSHYWTSPLILPGVIHFLEEASSGGRSSWAHRWKRSPEFHVCTLHTWWVMDWIISISIGLISFTVLCCPPHMVGNGLYPRSYLLAVFLLSLSCQFFGQAFWYNMHACDTRSICKNCSQSRCKQRINQQLIEQNTRKSRYLSFLCLNDPFLSAFPDHCCLGFVCKSWRNRRFFQAFSSPQLGSHVLGYKVLFPVSFHKMIAADHITFRPFVRRIQKFLDFNCDGPFLKQSRIPFRVRNTVKGLLTAFLALFEQPNAWQNTMML